MSKKCKHALCTHQEIGIQIDMPSKLQVELDETKMELILA